MYTSIKVKHSPSRGGELTFQANVHFAFGRGGIQLLCSKLKFWHCSQVSWMQNLTTLALNFYQRFDGQQVNSTFFCFSLKTTKKHKWWVPVVQPSSNCENQIDFSLLEHFKVNSSTKRKPTSLFLIDGSNTRLMKVPLKRSLDIF